MVLEYRYSGESSELHYETVFEDFYYHIKAHEKFQELKIKKIKESYSNSERN